MPALRPVALVEFRDEVEFVLECVYPESARSDRVTSRVHGLTVLVETLGHLQGLEFVQREIPRVIASVFTRPSRVCRRHVRDAIQVHVVQDHESVVPGGHDILLEIVRAHRIGQRFCGQGVFGQVTGCAAVRDHLHCSLRH